MTNLSLPPVFHPPLGPVKWGWVTRVLERSAPVRVGSVGPEPKVGDLLVARVEWVRHHRRIALPTGQRARLYPGDLVVGALGHRYATDAFDAGASIEGEGVDLLTNAGLLGQVRRRHAGVKPPTRLSVLGAVVDHGGRPINLIEAAFRPRPLLGPTVPVVLVLGTGMNAGKTTAARKLVRGLLERGRAVAALKITGSVCPNDRAELESTGVGFVRDFSDHGFPSTHLEPPARLESLAETMLADALDRSPDVIVAELADGVLQRETAHLMDFLRPHAIGAVLAAPCALSALKGVEVVQQAGIEALGVTGLISNAPLFQDEFSACCSVPILGSGDDGESLGRAVSAALDLRAVRAA